MFSVVADSFPNLARLVCVVSPGSNDDVITSPYNAVFALTHLKLNASCVLPFCNDSLMKVRHGSICGYAFPYHSSLELALCDHKMVIFTFFVEGCKCTPS